MRSSYTCLTRNNNNNFINGLHATPQQQSDGSDEQDSCARTAGYRWHRKRRWIRVGNVYQRNSCNNNSIRTSSYNNCNNINKNSGDVVKQPTFVVPCECVPPSTCVLCNRLFAVKTSSSMASKQHNLDDKIIKNNRLLSSGSRGDALSPVKGVNGKKTHLSPLKSGPILSKEGEGLCPSGWHPKVATSYKASLTWTAKSKQEILGRSCASYHPVLSHPSNGECQSVFYNPTSCRVIKIKNIILPIMLFIFLA